MVWRRRRQATPAVPLTAWQQSEQRWERWRRHPERRAMWWKVTCLGALGCNGLLVLGIIVIALQVKVKILPIVISEPGKRCTRWANWKIMPTSPRKKCSRSS